MWPPMPLCSLLALTTSAIAFQRSNERIFHSTA